MNKKINNSITFFIMLLHLLLLVLIIAIKLNN